MTQVIFKRSASHTSTLAAGEPGWDTATNQLFVGDGTTNHLIGPSGGGSGTVTSVSIVSANGFAGSVATATTTPAITISTTITGLLKGNGTSVSAAASGTDYAPATATTSALKGDGSGGFSAATLNDVGAATADYSLASHKITNVTDPTSAQDAATKHYVDTTIAAGSPPTGTAGGDLNGTYPNPTVDGLQGRAVSGTAPTSGQVLQWNGTAWTPTTPAGGGTTQIVSNKSSSYTAVSGDSGSVLFFGATSNVTLTLGSQSTGWWVDVVNENLPGNTVTISGSGIGSFGSSLVLTVGQSVRIIRTSATTYDVIGLPTAPGAAGQVLTSNGSSWVSSAPVGSSNGTTSLPATQSVTSTIYASVSGMSFTLPTAGTYLVAGAIRGFVSSATADSLVCNLRNTTDSVDVSGSETLIVTNFNTSGAGTANSAAMSVLITVTGSKVIHLQAKQFAGGGAGYQIVTGTGAGGTVLNWVRVA